MEISGVVTTCHEFWFFYKYYNIGIQFLKMKLCVSVILPQRIKLSEIILYFTGFTMKLMQNQKKANFSEEWKRIEA